MSCVLRIIGKDFDPDAFQQKTGLIQSSIFYKGEPRFKSKPDGEKVPHSGFSMTTSDAAMDDYNTQLAETIIFLRSYQEQLTQINTTQGIDYAYIDFGIRHNYRAWLQSQYLPLELVALASSLGLGIEISTYNPGKINRSIRRSRFLKSRKLKP